jgi:hypothetical protein
MLPIFEQGKGYYVTVFLLFHDLFEKKFCKDMIFLKMAGEKDSSS